MSKRIRVDDNTHVALAALKGEGETFDELLSHFVRDGDLKGVQVVHVQCFSP